MKTSYVPTICTEFYLQINFKLSTSIDRNKLLIFVQQKGDILVQVNGTVVTDINHQEAINMIKACSNTVKLLLKKGDGTVPEINK